LAGHLGGPGNRRRSDSWKRQILPRFSRAIAASEAELSKIKGPLVPGAMQSLIPEGGIHHNHVNRMLLTSGVEHYAENVPMALYLRQTDERAYLPRHYKVGG
ncbi:MAG TPA: hypothetical protein VLZ84_01460, partial [Asticcacaulis sp.]|nr:hypothetical protein [Asticcacaulis sp.]